MPVLAKLGTEGVEYVVVGALEQLHYWEVWILVGYWLSLGWAKAKTEKDTSLSGTTD